MGTSITVRGVPEDVHRALLEKAGRSGRSLQQFLLNQLAMIASRSSMEEVIAQARARVSAAGTTLSLNDILEAKSADRR